MREREGGGGGSVCVGGGGRDQVRGGGSGKREREKGGGGEREEGREERKRRKWGEIEGGGEISREVVRTETDNILVRVESQLQHSAVYSPQRDTEGPKFWDSL